jgi:hypothetical protein
MDMGRSIERSSGRVSRGDLVGARAALRRVVRAGRLRHERGGCVRSALEIDAPD